jgi:SAM-dependent methyltransferase
VSLTFAPMALVERTCPLCGSDSRTELVVLTQDDFTTVNATYRLDRVPDLGLDPEQRYPIVSCDDCGMAYSRYHLDDETEGRVYTEIIDAERSLAKVGSLGRKRGDLVRCLKLLELVDSPPPLTLVDYGCGWGTLLRVAQGLGIEAVGFDATSWKTDWARANGLRVYDEAADVERHAPFDLLVCTSVLEHLREPRRALEWMTTVARPGAVALVDCVVGAASSPEAWGRIRRQLEAGEPIPKEINPWEHLNYFTPAKLTELMREYGFEPAKDPGAWVPGAFGLRGVVELVVRPRLRRDRRAFGFWRFQG